MHRAESKAQFPFFVVTPIQIKRRKFGNEDVIPPGISGPGLFYSFREILVFRRGHRSQKIWEPNLCLSQPQQWIHKAKQKKPGWKKPGIFQGMASGGCFWGRFITGINLSWRRNPGILEGEMMDYKLIPNHEIPAGIGKGVRKNIILTELNNSGLAKSQQEIYG